MPAWATGLSLGPYVLLSPLGAGGMGEVWASSSTMTATGRPLRNTPHWPRLLRKLNPPE